MKSTASTAAGDDLIDRIAQALPVEVRADYYRELNYCRSLSEHDEMLRILRAMQFLTLLMNQTPQRVVEERERLERLFGTALERIEQAIDSSTALHRQLTERLSELPAEVARGLSPPEIAREVNESLRQQFVRSTIPETAQAVAAVASDMKRVSGEFAQAVQKLDHAYDGAARRAQNAVADLHATALQAMDQVRRAAKELSTVLGREFRWSVCTLSALALVVGIALGILCQRWLDQPLPVPKVEKTQPQQAAPQEKARHY
jgi:methyl-accepting chemotaxis protein